MRNLNYIIIVMFLFLISCQDDDNADDSLKLYKITEVNIQGITVEVLSDTENLYTGYNNVILNFKKEGKSIEVELVKSMVFIDIDELPHSTPREEVSGNRGFYVCPIVFVMPSSEGVSWYFDLEFKYKGVRYKRKVPFEVEMNSNLQSFIFNEKEYFVSLVTPRYPNNPKIGLNVYKIVVYERWSNIQYPPFNNFEIAITPIKTGIENSLVVKEDLISVGKGYYEGKVDFSTSGNWTVTSEISNYGEKISEVSHSFNF